MKNERIVRVRLLPDGTSRRVRADGSLGAVVKPRLDPVRANAPAAFEPDADTPLLTARELKEFVRRHSRSVNATAIRKRLRMSQAAFAALFGLSVRTIQEWEQGRRQPEGPARALLRVIEREPAAVRRALEE